MGVGDLQHRDWWSMGSAAWDQQHGEKCRSWCLAAQTRACDATEVLHSWTRELAPGDAGGLGRAVRAAMLLLTEPRDRRARHEWGIVGG